MALGPVTSVDLQLVPTTITADGVMQSTATATAMDMLGNPVPGETGLTITSGGTGDTVSNVTDNSDGTYTATITSTASGNSLITATDGLFSDNATLTKNPGPAATVAVGLAPNPIQANGTDTSSVTVTVSDANSNPVPGDTIALSSTDTGIQFSSVTDNQDGTYSATLTSSKTAGAPQIIATDTTPQPNVTGQTQLTQTATNVAVRLQPALIPANGASTTTATATVTDANGNGVPGDVVTFSPSDSGVQVGATTDHGDGTYTATLTASQTPNSGTVQATDTTASISGQANLVEFGPANGISVAVLPTSIVADGSSTSTATATVTDAQGNPVTGDNLQFSSTDNGIQFGPVTDNLDGTYTATLTSSTTAGSPMITATDSTAGGVNGGTTLTQTPGPAVNVAVLLQPNTIVANGTSTSTVTATVTDAHANPIAGHNVQFSSTDTAIHFGQVTDNQDGTYTATLTSSTTPGSPTITATDTTAATGGQATLHQTPGSATTIGVRLVPATLLANGTSTSTAIVTVADAHGNAVPGESVHLASTDSGIHIGAITDNGDGTYSATLTSSTTVGKPTITATDRLLTAHATLTLTAGHATNVSVSVAPLAIPANRVASSTVTVTITDAHAHPLAGQRLTLSSTDKGLAFGAITDHGDGTYTAKVTSSLRVGNPTITAADTSVSPSVAGHTAFVQTRPGSLGGVFLNWSFFFAPNFTKVLKLVVSNAPVGAHVVVGCHGKGCPFSKRTIVVTKFMPCGPHGKQRCLRHGIVHLAPRFSNRLLRAGATITIDVAQRGLIGKHYRFVVRRAHPPRQQIVCLAPDSSIQVPC